MGFMPGVLKKVVSGVLNCPEKAPAFLKARKVGALGSELGFPDTVGRRSEKQV